MAWMRHEFGAKASFAQKPVRCRKTCGKKATAGVPQRGRRLLPLELWQISTIMGLTESWNLGGKLRACEQVVSIGTRPWRR
jgi:hypothetical protein